DQIRHDFPVVDREPFASAPETGHHFIGDQENAVLVAKITQALDVSVRWDKNSVGAGNRLDDQRGDRFCAFELDHLFRACKHFFRCVPTSLNTVVILRYTEDTGDAWLGCPATWIASERQRARRAAVITAIARADLVSSAIQACD